MQVRTTYRRLLGVLGVLRPRFTVKGWPYDLV